MFLLIKEIQGTLLGFPLCIIHYMHSLGPCTVSLTIWEVYCPAPNHVICIIYGYFNLDDDKIIKDLGVGWKSVILNGIITCILFENHRLGRSGCDKITEMVKITLSDLSRLTWSHADEAFFRQTEILIWQWCKMKCEDVTKIIRIQLKKNMHVHIEFNGNGPK